MTSNPQKENTPQTTTGTASGKTSPVAPATAPTAPRSYANATKKSFAVNDQARAGETTPSTKSTPQHGQSPSISSVNDKPSMQQNQAPVAGGPTIVNGNTFNDHARKPSVTISAAGASGYIANGGPSGRSNNIRFGQLDTQESQATGNSENAQNQQQNLGVAPSANAQITSPDASPSPIPQPLVSGGRPPSSLQGQGNNLNFGSPSGGDQADMNRSMRPNMPQGPQGPNAQPGHYRRESAHSAHGDMSGHNLPGGPGRGGYQGGRNNRGYQQNQMGYSPNPGYRATSNHRGGPSMGHQFHPRGGYGSYNPARSPALSNANPTTPPVSHVPMAAPQMPPQHYGYPQMGHQGYPPPAGYDYYYAGAAAYPMQQMPYIAPSPPRPMPPQPSQAPFIPGTPAAQGTPLSRSPSQVSASERPGSSLGHTHAPSVSANQGHSHHASQPSNSQLTPQFVVPKKSGVTIRDQSGNIISFDKATSSPVRATPSPVKISTPAPTPPPQQQPQQQQQQQQDQGDKSGEEKKQGFRDAIARAAENAKKEAEDRKATEVKPEQKDEPEQKPVEEPKEVKKAPEVQAKEPEAPAPVEAPKEVAAPAVKEEAPKAAEPAKPADDEIDFDAIEREMAEKEAAEEAAEQSYREKKQKLKEEADRKAKEEAANYNENLKKAEREAEALEEARAKKLEAQSDTEKKAALDALVKSKDAQTPTSTESPAIPTPAESGAATPVSDSSMGPPQKPASATKKPTSLKVETVKSAEPPQATAAMKSLQSAKFLEDPHAVSYPASITSPSTTDRKLQYNKEFLLQFQNVFKDKPFLEWDNRIKETLGDATTDSARTPSRGGQGLGARGSSARGSVPASFGGGMGTFGQPGSKGPAGADRFPPMGIRGPAAVGGGAFGQFPRNVGMGAPMSRTGSSNAMQQPGSPRVGSHRGGSARAGSHRNKHTGGRREEETNKSMPLTANLDLKPLTASGSGWKPRSVGNASKLSDPTPEGHLPPDVVQRKVKSSLNKMTPEKFDKIADQILTIVAQSKDESDGRTLRQIIQLTFEKATDEAHWAPMYAKFCMRMLESMSPEIKDENIRDRNGNVVTGGSLFRKYLLNRCQEEFERGWKVNLPEKPEGVTEEIAMLSEEYYRAAAAKRRGLGLVKFIGELFKLGMLTERIMHECVKKLVDYQDVPDEAEIESLCNLLRTIGGSLDVSEKGRGMMDAYFSRINMMMATEALSSRHRFMLLDVIDLRKCGWKSKDSEKGPKTIQEIREEAARAQQEAEMERMRQQANRRGGGGDRMAMGRGDARSYGYGNQAPPPDYASSKVGSDDLRRLKSSRGQTQAPSFGPTSMFGSRNNSGRRNLGPGGNLVRGSEDSRASSRTGTPPGGKKDDKSSSANAFSALASLDQETAAASPPSNPPSPALTKATPATEQPKPDDK